MQSLLLFGQPVAAHPAVSARQPLLHTQPPSTAAVPHRVAFAEPQHFEAILGSSEVQVDRRPSGQQIELPPVAGPNCSAALVALLSSATLVAGLILRRTRAQSLRNDPRWVMTTLTAYAAGDEQIPEVVPINDKTAKAAPVAPEYTWKGAKLKPLAITLAVGILFSLIPCPATLDPKAWNLLAIFLSTITGIITGPLPLGAVALLALGVTILTGTLTFAQAFSAMSSEIPWLIALAFFFARGFIKTGLGNRIAYQFVRLFGKTSLGLTYSLVFSEAVLAPAIPSVAARAGGIFLPLVKALSEACGSRVGDGTERKLGAYLCLTCFQTSTISSAMFLTAMAANPLSAKLALSTVGAEITWGSWALAASVPGILSLIAIPLVVYILYPPEMKSSPEAPAQAEKKLEEMGPITMDEKIMGASLLTTVGLWVFGASIGVGSVPAALVGLGTLLISGVLTWGECLKETVAWDTLTWFGALIAMASYLNSMGLIKWFAGTVTALVGGMPAGLATVVLTLVYFYSHYLFASGAAHIGAMYAAFLAVAVSLNAPPMAMALLLAFLSNLMGGLTHYGIGSAPPYYGTGYVPLQKWWAVGAVCSVANLLIWAGVGGIWWKFLGLI
jgi:anion transporter